MVVRVDVSPDLLQWAVERAGWDDATIERRVPTMNAWITGTAQPTLKQLEDFASATHAPFGMLFLPTPPDEEIPIPDMRTVGNTAVPQPSADLLDTIYICQRRQEWYRGFAQEHGLIGPEFVGSANVDTPPVRVAEEMRDLLSFNQADRRALTSWTVALRSLVDRIEGAGVLVMINGVVGADTHRKLDPEEFRGFALSDQTAPLIFVNGADTKAAQIFTIVHEFAHIWLGGSALSDANMASRTGVEEELWCNGVAAEFLVPLADLRGIYRGEPTVEELERIARDFRVSTLVVLKRLYDAEFLSWFDYRELFEGERRRVLQFIDGKRDEPGGGDYYRTQPLRLSRRFARAVIDSAMEGTTTFREAYQLLGTRKRETFDKLAERLGVV
ncbi:ImmA/IrrE family metallo-endopeptidase [Dietzia sp. UBA5065]|jgi:Zn-dependent peptidase ImmA (M78 family)|uniref:ImmA/IrrE family metallo-endopeptidase n=1 Tax=Dietzia sp. UBA5065 TaxID=1946422 RepID=UPI0025C3A3F7|nr:ImmA/IrrE family metallo-endopeptidase [Dietzia sp. UBA5065]